MNPLERLRRLLSTGSSTPPDPALLQQVHRAGYELGYWQGFLEGQQAALESIRAELTAQRKDPNELEPQDIERIKKRLVQ